MGPSALGDEVGAEEPLEIGVGGDGSADGARGCAFALFDIGLFLHFGDDIFDDKLDGGGEHDAGVDAGLATDEEAFEAGRGDGEAGGVDGAEVFLGLHGAVK